ncbi:BTAD domain-containing putative transcriptional regulator [Streptomyces sp. NPDC050560]|uniref:AfsR/SARP family transcriptional regulator n=1 Tax=Streptomyces sp. NPDC050560 TaxID=3365630 RepID=UPI0037A1FC8A
MHIHLLGAVHVVNGERRTRPGSGRVRSLLAALAWQPGELVPDSRLIERIWGQRLPADPMDALYTCAKRLRGDLGLAGGAGQRLVVRLRGGYLLDTPRESVDLHTFRTLVRSAREAKEQATAACRYERALGMTTATPLADVDSAWADGARELLAQERRSALVAAARTWLRAGHHTDLVPELMSLAQERPLDEAVAGLLMEALYRDGRTAEALACYASVRRRLVDEVGAEPGPELRAAQQRLLSHTAGAPGRLGEERDALLVPCAADGACAAD